MFRPLAVSLGLRYIRAKKRSHFVSFISLTSMLGIAIGVLVLITVLSVMNGFDGEIHQRFFGMVPEVTVSTPSGDMSNWQAALNSVRQVKGVKEVAPYVGGQGLLTHHGQIVPVVVTGVLPKEEQRLIKLQSKMIAGRLSDMDHFGIVLGKNLANRLHVRLGDKVTLMIPKATITMAGMVPRFKRFRVVGVFSAGSGFNFDSKLSFINLHDAQKLFQMGNNVSGLRVKIENIYDAPRLAMDLLAYLGSQFRVGNWTEQFGAFFKAVKLEKTMMFFILLLIIAVAAFNLVSSLVMVVNDKQAEIAIMRTLGATPKMILLTFMVQGTCVGLIGMLIGLVLGLLLAYNVTDIVDALQSFFGSDILSSNVYFVDFLPSKIEPFDVIVVCGVALLLSFLATLYPAYKASRIQVVEALRYE